MSIRSVILQLLKKNRLFSLHTIDLVVRAPLRCETWRSLLALTDSMEYRDPRQAIQLPFEVQGAGLVPNARPTADEEKAELNTWSASMADRILYLTK